MANNAHSHRIWLAPCLLAGVLTAQCPPAIAAQGENSYQNGDVLTGSGALDLERIDALIRDGRYDAAEQSAREALSDLEAAGQGQTREAAWCADRLVEALLQGGKGTRPETLARAKQAVEIKEHLFGPDDIETARSQIRLGRVLTSTLAFTDAQQLLERSLGILESSLGGASIDVASALESIGNILIAQSHFDSARQRFDQALAVRETLHGPDDLTVANTLYLLGECASSLNDVPTAMQLLQRSQRIYERSRHPEHPDLANPLTALGQVLRVAGDYDQARTHLERAVQIIDASFGPDSPLVAHPLNALGLVLTDMGELTLAARDFERALAIETREYGTEHLQLASTLNNFGILRMSMGYFVEAEGLFAEAARLNEKFRGPWNLDTASSIESRGIALAEAERYAEVEPYFARALEIRIRVIGEDKPMIVNSLHNLSTLSGVLGDYAKQKEYALRALAVIDRIGDTNGYRRGAVMNALATASRGLGDLDSALRYSEQQLVAMQATFGPFHPEVARALLFQARVLVEDGQYAAGMAVAARCDAMSRDHVALTARAATEDEALQHAATRLSSLGLLITTAGLNQEGATEAASTAWDAVIRARALVFDEMLTRRRATAQSSDPELARLRDELTGATGRLAKLIVGGPGGVDISVFRADVQSAREEQDRAERSYAARNEQFREQLEASRAGLGEVASALPRDAALVAFVQYGHIDVTWPAGGEVQEIDGSTPSYAAFVLPRTGSVPVVVQLGAADQIDVLVGRLRQSLTQEMLAAGRSSAAGEAAYRSVAEEFRRRVWDPVAVELNNSGQVFVVPDGSLNLVDFAALPVGKTQYLAETLQPLHYLSSERDLLMDAPVSGDGELLALGAPDFDDANLFAALRTSPTRLAMAESQTTGVIYRGSRSACGSFQSMSFEPLPAASQEVAEVLDLWRHGATDEGNAIVLTGASASETAFKQRAAGKQVLHLATHGFFLGGDCGSALDPQEGNDVTNENPLLLSGLVLAGANHRTAAGPDEDDGILTAEEIATLDLTGTEWAVLSACDTGTGEIRAGEGVLGLQRAFRMAGARTTIMSLWPVEDDAAREWMSALYRHHFTEGMSTMDSVHGASVDLLQRRRAQGLSTHPFYWAGFIASGDWR